MDLQLRGLPQEDQKGGDLFLVAYRSGVHGSASTLAHGEPAAKPATKTTAKNVTKRAATKTKATKKEAAVKVTTKKGGKK